MGEKKPWPINGATAEVQMWAGVVMAALLPPRAGGYRRNTVTGGCRGPDRWCERTECRCRAQWSPQTAVTSCDTRKTRKVLEKSEKCVFLLFCNIWMFVILDGFWWLQIHLKSEDAGALKAVSNSICAFVRLPAASIGGKKPFMPNHLLIWANSIWRGITILPL